MQAVVDPNADRMPWPDSWFRDGDPADAQACRDLWACVLATCLRGALRDATGRRERGNFLNVNTAVGKGWIGGRDFHIVCALAGLDAAAVRAAVARAARDAHAFERMLNRLGYVGKNSRASLGASEEAA